MTFSVYIRFTINKENLPFFTAKHIIYSETLVKHWVVTCILYSITNMDIGQIPIDNRFDIGIAYIDQIQIFLLLNKAVFIHTWCPPSANNAC